MAITKKGVDTDVEEVVIDSIAVDLPVEEEVAATEEKEVVSFNEVDTTDHVEKTVKIRMAVSHTCHIGGENYVLEKGKQYNVPFNVKHILNEAGFLSPL